MKKLLTIMTASLVFSVPVMADMHMHKEKCPYSMKHKKVDHIMNGIVKTNVNLSSSYMLRGLELGGASVSGDVTWKHHSGLYLGAAVIGGDVSNGTEQNYFVGLKQNISDYKVNAHYTEFSYPSWEESGVSSNPGYGELGLDVSREYATLSVIDNRTNDSMYYSLGLDFGKVGVTMGTQRDEDEYNHIQFDYKPSKKVTVSVSRADDSNKNDSFSVDEDVKMFVSYSLPL